jgi:hypothetical protein
MKIQETKKMSSATGSLDVIYLALGGVQPDKWADSWHLHEAASEPEE